ncbi:MAG: glycosyltransferase family 4 protein [Desulfuromonadaceae bacterium]|nr:glycosyltransferase family 4 protein [Desulfuromonadaceae bacterium]
MKLAFSLFKYFPYGGLQRDCIKIAQECVARGHSVDIFALETSGEIPQPLTVTCVDVRARVNYRRYAQFAIKVKELVSKGDYAALVGFNKMPGLDFYYAADPCFAAKAQERSCVYNMLPRTRSFLAAEKSVFAPQVDTQILLISPIEQEIFTQIYHTQPERMHLLPPGIQRDRTAPPDYIHRRQRKRTELGLNDTHKMLLMVGSGFKTKGADRSLLALASLPEAVRHRTRLYIVGQDNPRPFIRMAKELKVAEQVIFLGGRDDIPDLLFAADVLLHPAYRENTGTVLLESIAAQLPVLCTDVCGYAFHILDARCGYVIPSPFEQNEMNAVLSSMLDSPEINLWKENAAQYVKENDLFSMPERAVDVIEMKTRARNHEEEKHL